MVGARPPFLQLREREGCVPPRCPLGATSWAFACCQGGALGRDPGETFSRSDCLLNPGSFLIFFFKSVFALLQLLALVQFLLKMLQPLKHGYRVENVFLVEKVGNNLFVSSV